MHHPSVDALARAVVRPGGRVRVPPPPVAVYRTAKVLGVNTGGQDCTVLLNGSVVPIHNVPYPNHYTPVAGDRCQVVINAVGGVGPGDIAVSCKYGP